MTIRLLVITTVCLLSACSGIAVQSVGHIPWETVVAGGNPPPQSSLAIAQEPLTVVIRDEQRWTRLLEERVFRSGAGSSPKPIDFRKDMVIAVFLGARINGCYAVRIDDVYRKHGRVQVQYSEWVPFGARICTYGTVYPVHIITVPSSSDPVDFIRTLDTPVS